MKRLDFNTGLAVDENSQDGLVNISLNASLVSPVLIYRRFDTSVIVSHEKISRSKIINLTGAIHRTGTNNTDCCVKCH